MAGGRGGNGADPNGTGGQAGTDDTEGFNGGVGGNGGSSLLGSGGGAGGGSGDTGGAGGNGGAALGGTVPNSTGTGGLRTTYNGVAYQGGDGGNGLAGPSSGDGGGGGGGGSYAYFTYLNAANNSFGITRIGGNGGDGGAGNGTGGGGGGGAGGYGLVAPGTYSATTTATLTGGNGGNGGAAGGPGGVGGSGGNGGIGLFLDGGTVANSGTITGGNGGLGGAAHGGIAGTAGQGGAGIAGQNLNLTNTGTITGGLANAGNGARADAIDFTGGTNSLTLSNGGTTGTLNGGIGIAGSLSIDPGTAAGGNVTLANQLHDYNGTAGSLNKTGAGTLTLNGANTYSGGTTISAGTLNLGAPTSAGTGAITFATMSGTATARLGLDVAAQPANAGTFTNTLANFGSGNELALAGLTNSSVSYNSSNSSITVTGTRSGGGQVSENFVLSSPRTTSFTATVDGQGNTIIRAAAPANPTNPSQPSNPAPCYVTGTRIRVLRGRVVSDVPVERLAVGDLAITGAGKPRPIRWIGSRGYPDLTTPKHDRPVRIRADAIGPGVPARDLLVSPDHALWVDGLFVAAGHLVNGTSIIRGEVVADLTYWHVELDSHDLLLAENTPAESFLPAPGVRSGFDGYRTNSDADASPMPYAPRTEVGPELAALRKRLIRRSGLPTEPTQFGAVRAWLDRCDGTRVAGWAQDAAYPDAPVCLDIVVDGRIVAMTVAAEYRADIAAVGVGDGHHGFDLGLAMPLVTGVPHVVEVRRSVDDAVICAMAADAAGIWTPLLSA
ncbi:Hint domain-containing protein [Methylobacterium sp. CM6257]